MSLRAEIRGVLSAGQRTAEQISELCGCTAKQAAQNLSTLKTEGKVKVVGSIEGRNSYGIANWPEKATKKDAHLPRNMRAEKTGKRTKRARAAEIPAPAPIAANGGAKFAVLDDGTFSLIKAEVRVDLDPAEFTRMRVFVERTEPAWNPTEE
jgi:hypothetical protein